MKKVQYSFQMTNESLDEAIKETGACDAWKDTIAEVNQSITEDLDEPTFECVKCYIKRTIETVPLKKS